MKTSRCKSCANCLSCGRMRESTEPDLDIVAPEIEYVGTGEPPPSFIGPVILIIGALAGIVAVSW